MASRRRPGRARAGLGQHFLRRPEVCSRLVGRAEIGPTDTVVEIGAGTGSLTRALARKAARVIAVEVDDACVRVLRENVARYAGVEIVHDDFMRWPLPEGRFKVFANPPFAHGAAIVRRLGEGTRRPTDAWLVLEHGAARRFVGSPFAPETLRALLLKPEWHLELPAELAPHDFVPPARQRCSLLWMARRPRPLVDPAKLGHYADFVAFAFGRQGNAVDECLRGVLTAEQLRRCAVHLCFDLRAQPSSLSFDQWLGLFRCFDERGGRSARRRVRGAMERLPR